VAGAPELFRAAFEVAGARTFVYISAAGVIMDNAGSPIRNADESAPTFPNHFSAYLASKARAERLVLAADKPSFRTIALRPPAIWGPGDPFSRGLPAAIKSGQFAFIDGGDYAFATCHVDNVVEAVECALKRGDGGCAFFLSDRDKQTFREFVASLANLQGLSIDKLRSMPYWLASTIGRLFETIWAVRRKDGDPPISRSMIRMIGREFSIDDAAARRGLYWKGFARRWPAKLRRASLKSADWTFHRTQIDRPTGDAQDGRPNAPEPRTWADAVRLRRAPGG
jgi:nucleoside-diphosphate-sugar epimerase